MRAGSVDSLASVSICESVSSDHTPPHGAVAPNSPRQAEMGESSPPPGGLGDGLSAAEARDSRCSIIIGAAEARNRRRGGVRSGRARRASVRAVPLGICPRPLQELLGDLSKTIALATSCPVKVGCAPGRRSCRRLTGGRRSHKNVARAVGYYHPSK
eukprot:scaffold12986_cov148-Isochrysis_galbana.AAC.5